MRIVVFEVEAWERQAFRGLERDHEVTFVEDSLDAGNAGGYAEAEVVSTFIYSELDRAVLERLPALRFIATRSTGYDHIDLEHCRSRDIDVSNVPSYGENTVAEHVFALLLAISHHIVEAANRTRRGDFSQQGLRGFDLEGRTIAVIGTGAIGRHVVRIAKGFGMEVVAHDLHPDDALAAEMGVRYLPLEEALASADVVTLHVPGGEATRHLLSEREFARMKDGAVLINTARGNVVDTRALLRALSEGKLAAAGLDVLADEPAIREEAELLRSFFAREYDLETLLADHILLRLRNVVITPHSAFNTREAVSRILATTRENIEAFARGAPRNLVS